MWLIKNPPLGREDIGNKTQYQSSFVLVESFIRAEYTVGLACRAGAWFLRTDTQQRDMNAIHSRLRTACENRRAANTTPASTHAKIRLLNAHIPEGKMQMRTNYK